MAITFLKMGTDSAVMAQQAEIDRQQQREQQGKMWRFYLKEGDEAQITFVDGDLSNEGFLIPPRFYEHDLYLNGSYHNFFVCPEKTSPDAEDKCPLCEKGESRPYLAALFTVIDHREVKSTKDPSKVYKDSPRLFVAKTSTFELLNKLAVKRGGLAGVTFDVSRTKGDKIPSVGNVFDFVEKREIKVLEKLYVRETVDPKTNVKSVNTIFVPANYEEEIVFRSGDELRKMGFGTPAVAAGTMTGFGGNSTPSKEDFSKHL